MGKIKNKIQFFPFEDLVELICTRIIRTIVTVMLLYSDNLKPTIYGIDESNL